MKQPEVTATASNTSEQPGVSRATLAARVAWLSGVFTCIVAVVMLFNYWQWTGSDPVDSPRLAELKTALAQQPADAAIKQAIREEDHLLRQQFESQRQSAGRGGWLLLAGAVVFVVSLRQAVVSDPSEQTPPFAKLDAPDRQRELQQGRYAVGVAAITLLAGSVALWAMGSPRLSYNDLLARAKPADSRHGHVAGGTEPTPTVQPLPSREMYERNWPRFRGPGGLGVVHLDENQPAYPTQWNGSTGDGILWKTPVPISGHNSPVVWENYVFCSGATKEEQEVYTFDTATGDLLWQREVRVPKRGDVEP
ncbi:MAG: PQQ-like beta-propeller repeat protein, partial [Rhodospirillales bacterium]|nr:PQQ-like beta-propeller repeat protein [Rhodospirillales bacterium]